MKKGWVRHAVGDRIIYRVNGHPPCPSPGVFFFMNEPTLDKPVTTESLDQAVLVCDAGLSDGGPDRSAASPLLSVAGMPLILRATLVLQRAGIKELILLAEEGDGSVKSLLRDPRVTIAIRWMPLREFPPGDPRTWKALGADIRGTCVITGGQTIFPVALIQRLREEAKHGHEVTLVSGLRGSTHDAADLLVAPGGLLRRIGTDAPENGEPPLRWVVRRARDGDAAKTLDLAGDGRLWCATVRDRASAKAAEQRILSHSDSELDGYVDLYFNRVLARPLTRLFLLLGFSPNLITFLSIGLGLVSALCFAMGSYAAALLGAVLLQITAVVDCCDGDVARATLSESEFGAQLDIIGDNVVHMAVFGGIAYGLYRAGAEGAEAWLPVSLGAAAIFGTAMAVLLVRRVKRLLESPVLTDSRQAARARLMLSNVASRDFTVVVLLFALLDALDWFLLFTAVGVNLFWIVMAWCSRPPVTARA